MVNIVREIILYKQSALFVKAPIILQKTVSKGSERRRKNLVQLVIWATDRWIASLVNVLDADLNIIVLPRF